MQKPPENASGTAHFSFDCVALRSSFSGSLCCGRDRDEDLNKAALPLILMKAVVPPKKLKARWSCFRRAFVSAITLTIGLPAWLG